MVTGGAGLLTHLPGHTHTLGTTALVRHLMANLTRNSQRSSHIGPFHKIFHLFWKTVTLLPLNIDTDLLRVSPQLLVTFLLCDIVTPRDREAGAHCARH